MTLRVSWAAVAFLSTIALGKYAGDTAHAIDGADNPLRHAVSSEKAETKATASLSTAATGSANDVLRVVTGDQSSELTSAEIQHELASAVGETQPVRWSAEAISGVFKLSRVLTHVQNLDSSFELLFDHVLPERGSEESKNTYYTSRIHEADEKNLSASFVFSRLLESRDGEVVFDEQSRAQYFFSLKPQAFADSFSLRRPEGAYHIADARKSSFNPLSVLTTENGTFDELGEYQYEMLVGGVPHIVSATPRLVRPDVLSIEVEIRPAQSLVTTTFVLVYNRL